jgi:hypothetical protein
MGYSKFEFRPIGFFRYIEGYSIWRVQKQARVTLFWTDTVKADSHIACRAHAVPLPCRAAKGLKCIFPI